MSSWRLSLPAPAHSPARSCQGCALFGSCLPPQTTLRGLKRQARGAAGSSCPAGSRAPPAAPPARPRLGQPIPPAVEETRPPKTRPARPPAPGGGGDRGGLRERGLPCPPRQPASLCFSFKTRSGFPSVSSYQVGQGEGGRPRRRCRLLMCGPFAHIAGLRPHTGLGDRVASWPHFTDGKVAPERTSHTGQQVTGLGPSLAAVTSQLLTHAARWGDRGAPSLSHGPHPLPAPSPQPRRAGSLVHAVCPGCKLPHRSGPLSTAALRGVEILEGRGQGL